MMKPISLSEITPALLGFAIMAGAGWHLAKPSDEPADAMKSASGTDASRPDRPAGRSSHEDSATAARMSAIRNAASPADKMRSTLALAHSIPSSEFAAWVEGDRFSFRKGPELSIFRMIIFERWMKEDPASLIPWAIKNNYGQAGRALTHLANNDPQLLIDHYRSNPAPASELQTLREVAKNHPALALQRLQELSAEGIPSGARRQTGGLLKELAGNSPAALEAMLGNLSPDIRREAENALLGQRLITSPVTEVRALWQRADGWQLFEKHLADNPVLGAQLMTDLSNLPASWRAGMADYSSSFIDQSNGRQWLDADLQGAGFSPDQAKEIRERALNRLASGEPEFVLKSLDESGLDSNSKAGIISNTLRGAQGDPAAQERLINLLGSEKDRQLARDQITLSQLAGKENETRTPQEWLTHLGSISNAENHAHEVINQLKSWDKTKMAELTENFREMPVDQQQNIARAVAARIAYYDVDPDFAGEAIRSLVIHSPSTPVTSNDSPVLASSNYAVKLFSRDPAAATSWIDTLPDGESKLWAAKNLAANWQQYDPKASADWVQKLPSNARDQVTEYLKTRK